MSMSNQLLEKFFRGLCTDEEKLQVQELFKNHPELLAHYLTEEGWKNFDPDPAKNTPTGKIREAIEARVGSMQPPVRKLRYGWVAAASVVAVTSLIFLLHPSDDNPKEKVSQTVSTTKKTPARSNIRNHSSEIKTFFLPDSSKVELDGNSDVSFNNPFIDDRRDVFLEGQAKFTVKKDNTKPFVVHSRDIATTVLGTVFSVNDKQKQLTTVHLFSGRVVVKKEGSGGQRFKDVYLRPGQQMILDEKDFSVRIKDASQAAVLTKISPVTPARPQVFDFNEKPLTEIFSLLQEEYKVTIAYDAAALQNMSFTGKFDRSKGSLESFLNTLCDLNELNLKKTSDNSFSIQVK